jgi:hypothetical protein
VLVKIEDRKVSAAQNRATEKSYRRNLQRKPAGLRAHGVSRAVF